MRRVFVVVYRGPFRIWAKEEKEKAEAAAKFAALNACRVDLQSRRGWKKSEE